MLIFELRTRLIECKRISYYRFIQFYNKMREKCENISLKFIKFCGMYVNFSLELTYKL